MASKKATPHHKPTTLLLVRHGQTPTTGQSLPGRAPGLHLSEAGHKQAAEVAERLASFPKIDAIYSSPLERTRETAAPLAKQRKQKVIIDKGLIECDFGKWTGGKLSDLMKLPEWKTVQGAPSTFRFPNGESFTEMQVRISTALDNIRLRHPGGVVVCFSHADPIKAALAHAMGTHLDLFQRIVVSTYQSVTGTGVKAVTQLMNERNGIEGEMAYKYPIDLNVIPQIDVFLDNGYTKEEMKMVLETKKIMRDDSIRVTSTTVRIPVMGGHSESVNIEFEEEFDLDEVKRILADSPGIIVVDNPATQQYPMPMDAHEKDEVFVGRIRRDETQPKTLNMWIVSDNLRKGAATNAVQIAEYLLASELI
jgi:probable phosphomutase (TIGR03848 family)